jgi:TIR domain-containing protein/PAN domain-containing protein
VTDIFFSYSSADRERVRPVRDALVAQGFEVFWDQQVPAGVDWDTWIRQHLTSCKCAMVFWSSASITSRNVRHEATIADQEGKLIPVLLEPLNARQFPMGLYAQQAANLSGWSGDLNHEEWDKLRREYEAKLMPQWVRQRMDEKEAELVAERARRQGVERRDKTLQAQIAKEAETQLGLQRERDSALDEIAALKGTVQEFTRARSEAEARETDTLQQVAALKATVAEATKARSDAEQRLSKLRQTKAKEIVRSISPFVLAAALVTVGIWTYHLVRPAAEPPTGSAPPSVQQAELQAAKDEARRRVEEAEQFKKEAERQANLAADTDSKRQVAEAEQQRLREQVERQSKVVAEAQTKLQSAQAAARDADTKRQAAEKAASEADTKRKEAEAQQQQLKDQVQRLTTAVVLAPSFERRPNTEAFDKMPAGSERVSTVQACQERCAQSGACLAFTFSNASNLCLLYDLLPSFRSNTSFDSGVRQSLQTTVQSGAPQPPAQQAAALTAGQPISTKGSFEVRANTRVIGPYYTQSPVRSVDECENACKAISICQLFTYTKMTDWKGTNGCYLYSDSKARLVPTEGYDTGIRP